MTDATDYIETKKIRNVRFGLMGPREVKAVSAVQITSPDTFANGRPVPGGLFDLRMGTIERGENCATCLQGPSLCPGHFGYLQLAAPIFHPQFIDVIKKVMDSVCFQCGALLIEKNQAEETLKFKKTKRLDRVKKLIKSRKICPRCSAVQPNVKRQKNALRLTYTYREGDTERESILSPNLAREIMKRITDYDAEVLGFSPANRPEWMIMELLPISPPSMRPTVTTDGGQKGEDDLTVFLAHIIRANNTVREKSTAGNISDQALLSFIEIVNVYVAAMVVGGIRKSTNSNLSGRILVTRTGKPLTSIAERTSGKHGRLRKNAMGKRVNFSARSVISPDPNLDLDELGVPMQIAKILTFPEVVNEYNREELYQYIMNTKTETHPMAITVKQGNIVRTVKHIKPLEDIVLRNGDVVTRQLKDGDVALFNRQPTLHRMSMMGMKARIMKIGKTFRMNLSVTTPLNADFDGDEINGFLCQSITTSNEIWELTRPSTQIVTPQTNGPIIGIVQDSLVGAFLMTRYTTRLSKKHAMLILSASREFNGKMARSDSRGTWSGLDIMSEILPSISLKRMSNSFDEGWEDVKHSDSENKAYISNSRIIIKDGKLISGSIDKSVLGAKKEGGIAHVIFNDLGPEYTGKFLSLLQKFTNRFLVFRGFSVGLGDIVPNKEVRETMNKQVLEGLSEVKEIYNKIRANEYIPPVEMTIEEYSEMEISEKLNGVRVNVAEIMMKSLNPETNGLMGMVKSGSKGDALNIGQMSGAVGQQIVERKRIAPNFGSHRTLPYFWKYDEDPMSRGFVQHSFIQGLAPEEYFFHAMSGREGVIDTAVRTRDSGYISRRLMKAMEDIMVDYDNTVRNSNGQIVQFLYGEDGIDPTMIERQKFETVFLNNKEILRGWWMREDDIHKHVGDKVIKEILSPARGQDTLHILKEEVKQVLFDRDFMRFETFKSIPSPDDSLFAPVNVRRLIVNATSRFEIKEGKSELNPVEIARRVRELCDKLPRMFQNQLQNTSKNAEQYLMAPRLLCILIRSALNSKKVIVEYKLKKEAFEYLINEIEKKYLEAIVCPGEMVGAVVSQSLGEPSTQLSVEYNTEVVIKDNKLVQTIKIGEMIDNIVENATNKEKEINDGKTTYVNISLRSEEYHVPALGKDEKVRWKKIIGVTRHPPNGKLVKIETKSGRKVTATLAKSFITRKDNEILAINGSDLKIGHYLPIVKDLPTENLEKINEIDIMKYFKNEKFKVINGYIHPEKIQNKNIKIPQKMQLNENFGFLVGAYLAEGAHTKYFIYIANVDKIYQKKIVEFAESMKITSRIDVDKHVNRAKIVLSSMVLAKLIEKICGIGAKNKKLPDWCFSANDDFIKGLLQGYYDGDGSVAKETCIVSSSSDSEKLTDGLILLLTRFGIFARKRARIVHKKMRYETLIHNYYAKKYAEVIGSIVKHKKERLERIKTHAYKSINVYDMIPEVKLNSLDLGRYHNSHNYCIGRKTLGEILKKLPETHEDYSVINQAYSSNVFWDKIITLEYVDCAEDYVYDFTVEDDPIFCDKLGLVLNDTLNTSMH